MTRFTSCRYSSSASRSRFFFEAGADPGAEQHGVERLGQVIFRTAFDAAHHAGHVVEGGDHDDGNAPDRGIGLHPLQHGEPVEVGHQDVQQDQVEPLAAQEVEGRAAAGRALYPVALAPEPAFEDRAIVLLVVHHENVRRLDRRPDGRGFDGLVLGRDAPVVPGAAQLDREQPLRRAPDPADVALELRVAPAGSEQRRGGGDHPALRLAQSLLQRGELGLGQLAP